MSAHPDLIQRANELKQQAEFEADDVIRDRLIRMAEHYNHLAYSQSWSEANPPSVAGLSDVLTKGN